MSNQIRQSYNCENCGCSENVSLVCSVPVRLCIECKATFFALQDKFDQIERDSERRGLPASSMNDETMPWEA